MLLAGVLLAACANVRPVAQVGLLAPFEGNYRRTGYGALDMVRTALDDLPPSQTGIVPLALDTSLDPLRAAQKMAILPAVEAVLGPITLHEIVAAAPALGARDRLWLAPFAATSAGFARPDDPAWLDAMVAQFAVDASAAAVTRLVIGGWNDAGWWEPGAGLGGGAPIVLLPDLAGLQPGDGLLWLGDAAAAVKAVRVVRSRLPELPVWLAPWAADQLFAEQLGAEPGGEWGHIRFGAWLPSSPDVEDVGTQDSGTLLALLLPAATRIAAAQIVGGPEQDVPGGPWTFVIYAMEP